VIRVIHIGASIQSRGGVASVISGLLGELGRDPGLRVSAIPTTMCNDKGALYDLVLGSVALVRVAAACFSRPRPILQLHMSSKGSAFRKAIIARLARVAGAPCILHDHNVEKYCKETNAFMRSWIYGTFRRADAVITITDREKDFVRSLTTAPVETIRNGIYLPDPLQRTSADFSDMTHFLFLGKLMAMKGIFELLEAFATLCRDSRPVHLTLAGNGQVQEARQWVKAHNLEARADVPGWVTGEEKTRLLRKSDVLVLPSYHEGLPVSIIEAMSYGLPVIVTRVGGIPEMVVANETGLLVEPRDVGGLLDAMRELASDPERRRRFGQAARKKAEENYSLPVLCARMKEIYRRLAT
jgi:glycosyltransferase involved in cell wall biosynthesis